MDDVIALRDALLDDWTPILTQSPGEANDIEWEDRQAMMDRLDTLIAAARLAGWEEGHDCECDAALARSNEQSAYADLAEAQRRELDLAARLDAAVEARDALTPERLAKALVATTIFAGHAHDCPVWMNRMIELRGERVDLDTCTCWVKDEAPDRARRILAALPHPEKPRVERCAVCGVGRWVIAHDPEAGPSHHPFTPESR